MSDIYTIPQLSETLLPLFRSYGIRRAILFGSYGKGTATSKSDVDLLDISHINTDSPIAREINQTGVIIYEE
ncbi:MAG: nucleotidyltransferase domain-containing protein [Clostridiales bacterium]|nr:nucleotidyltransferase domain-containing protein [Clostridiales bacterium]